MPGGILLEPDTGLSINDFVAGVEFFKTLPSIDDPFKLRGPEFNVPAAQPVDQWLSTIQQQVVAQYRAAQEQPEPERLHGRVHRADDDHRLGQDLHDLHLAGRSSTAR